MLKLKNSKELEKCGKHHESSEKLWKTPKISGKFGKS